MIESDQSDKEQQDEMSSLAISNNSADINEHGKKKVTRRNFRKSNIKCTF